MTDFDFENYKGPFVAVPEPFIRELIGSYEVTGKMIESLQKCVSYEPDNHHNAALCQYCNLSHDTPQERYDKAWQSYIDSQEIRRASGDMICHQCSRRYQLHWCPLKQMPTIHILCDGSVVKLSGVIIVNICESCGKTSNGTTFSDLHYAGCDKA